MPNALTDHQIDTYSSFLVRLWQDAPDGPWRVSTQSVRTGEVMRFATIHDFYNFMRVEICQPARVAPLPVRTRGEGSASTDETSKHD